MRRTVHKLIYHVTIDEYQECEKRNVSWQWNEIK